MVAIRRLVHVAQAWYRDAWVKQEAMWSSGLFVRAIAAAATLPWTKKLDIHYQKSSMVEVGMEPNRFQRTADRLPSGNKTLEIVYALITLALVDLCAPMDLEPLPRGDFTLPRPH